LSVRGPQGSGDQVAIGRKTTKTVILFPRWERSKVGQPELTRGRMQGRVLMRAGRVKPQRATYKVGRGPTVTGEPKESKEALGPHVVAYGRGYRCALN